MNLFKKKGKSTPLIDIGARIRGLLLDSQMENPDELATILGCSEVSEDVLEREEEESDLRLGKIEYLFPLFYAHARLLAEGTVEYQRDNIPEEVEAEIPEEIWTQSRKMVEEVSIAALAGSISQLIDMGFLTIPKKYTR